MSTLQTLMALVVLIFVLSVIVQAVQEFLKSLLKTKADTMKKTIQQFMGAHLTLPQVEGALKERGLDITALEHFNKDDFRHLLDGIDFLEPQLGGIVCSAAATFEQKKDNIAAAYEAARASVQKTYTTRNKIFALVISVWGRARTEGKPDHALPESCRGSSSGTSNRRQGFDPGESRSVDEWRRHRLTGKSLSR
jgi:hypothetical protein